MLSTRRKFIILLLFIIVLLAFVYLNPAHYEQRKTKEEIPLDPHSTAFPPPDGGEYCDVHDFRSYINTTDEKLFQCVRTTTNPNVQICLYPNAMDIYVSTSIRGRGRWENEITEAITGAMSYYPDATFVDIGANLGIHTLVVAARGHPVIAVEPKWSSIQRFHKSVILNKYSDRIVLVKNAISDSRGKVALYSDDTNMGGSSISYVLRHKEYIQSIVMDDLLDVFTGTEAILKMDIQGSEFEALANSTRFFSQVKVHEIYMEWEEMASFVRSYGSTDKAKVLEMVRYLRSMGYVPYPMHLKSDVDPKFEPLMDNDMKNWSINIVWVKESKRAKYK